MTNKTAKSLQLLIVILLTVTLVQTPPVAQAQTTAPSIQLSPCKLTVGIGGAAHGVDAKCGVQQVPEDWSKPDGKKIDIHLAIVPATSPNPKGLPIFHFEGGPGGSAITAYGRGMYIPYSFLRTDHDIVLIDQRGTGQSASLQCTEVTDQALSDLAQASTDETDQTQSEQRLAACLKRVSAKYDPALYTSASLARDTDAIRAALGYDQIDIYGSSYGTQLAQYYLRDFGAHVHAAVLDSTVGPWDNFLLVAPGSIDTALHQVFTLCQADPVCNKAYPDLSGQLQAALDKLKDKPVSVTANSLVTNDPYPVTMTQKRFLYALSEMLTSNSLIGYVPMVISQAANGNYLISAGMLITLNELPDVSWGLYYSVNCAEDVAFFTPDQIKKYDTGGLFANVYPTPDELVKMCSAWRSAELSPEDVAPVKSDRPTLILSGAYDPITPVSYAQETNQRLSKSQLVVLPYQTHGVIIGSKCSQQLIALFLEAPEKAIDVSCADNDVRFVFAGAYSVDMAPYSAPDGSFGTVIPKGWTAQPAKAGSPLTFFESPDKLQFLGVGVLKGVKMADARATVIKAVADAYGAVDVQQEIDIPAIVFTLKVVSHALDRPDQVYFGMFMMREMNGNTYVVWQAAPANIFQAVTVAIAAPVFTSLQ